MKRKLSKTGWLIGCITSGVILMSSLAYAQLPGIFKPGSEPNGFRGIQWEQDISTVKDLVYLSTDPSYGGVQMYTRDGDELRIGAAKLENIIYYFWHDKFCAVRISTKGDINWEYLKQATFEKFGKGFQKNEYIEEYAWFGKNVSMVLEYNEFSEKGSLFIASNEISDQQEEWEKKKAKEGAKEGW